MPEEDKIASYEEIIAETASAYYIKFDRERKVWMAKSLVEVDEKDKEVTMPSWLYDEHFI